MSIRVVQIDPENGPEATSIEGTLESMQAIVGGYLEQFRAEANGDRLVVWFANEDGLMLKLAPNRFVPGLVGTVLVAAVVDSSEVSLTDDEIRRLTMV